MRITIKGTLSYIGPVETVGKVGMDKRVITITDKPEGAKFADTIAAELIKADCRLVDERSLGKPVVVTAYLNSREWTDASTNTKKFFTSVRATQIEFGENQPNGLTIRQDLARTRS